MEEKDSCYHLSLLAVTACSDEDDAVIAGGKGYLQLRLFAEGIMHIKNGKENSNLYSIFI